MKKNLVDINSNDEVITVVDEWGEESEVFTDTIRILSYINKEELIFCTGKVRSYCEGSLEAYVIFAVQGTVDDIEEKVKYSSIANFYYAHAVGLNADKYDPDKRAKDLMHKYMIDNEDKLFDKNGDYIDNEEILSTETVIKFLQDSYGYSDSEINKISFR